MCYVAYALHKNLWRIHPVARSIMCYVAYALHKNLWRIHPVARSIIWLWPMLFKKTFQVVLVACCAPFLQPTMNKSSTYTLDRPYTSMQHSRVISQGSHHIQGERQDAYMHGPVNIQYCPANTFRTAVYTQDCSIHSGLQLTFRTAQPYQHCDAKIDTHPMARPIIWSLFSHSWPFG